MAFTADQLKAWVGTLDLSEDDRKVVVEKLGGEKVIAKVGDSILSQQEFSRKMDALKADEAKLQKEYEDRVKKEDSFHGELATWKTGNEKKLADAVAAREQTEATLVATKEKIAALATQYGIPEDQVSSVMTSLNTPAPKKDETRQRDDDGRFLPREEFNKVAMDYVKIPAIITNLEREHERLFGPNGPSPDWEQVINEAGANKRTLKQQWETQFKVQERRDAIARETHDKEIADAVKRGEEQARSSFLAANPGLNTKPRDDFHGSPVLDRARAQAVEAAKGKKPDSAIDEARGVRSAIAAFNEGKYRDSKTNAA